LQGTATKSRLSISPPQKPSKQSSPKNTNKKAVVPKEEKKATTPPANSEEPRTIQATPLFVPDKKDAQLQIVVDDDTGASWQPITTFIEQLQKTLSEQNQRLASINFQPLLVDDNDNTALPSFLHKPAEFWTNVPPYERDVLLEQLR
jgi:hypothetical protein